MKKILAAVLAMVLCVSLLAACKDKKAEPVSSEVKPTEVTIKTVSMFGGADASAEAYANVVKAFDDANEYITVVDESTESSEEWKASVVSSFETGDNADVVFFFTTSDAEGMLDYVVPLSEIKEVYPDYCNWISQSAIDSVAIDGVQYAIPVKGYWEGLFVNEDLYKNNGIDLPSDWAKFTDSFAKLNEAGIIPMAFGADIPHYWIEHFILAAGPKADHAANPGTDVSKVPESWKTGLGFFKTLYDAKGFAEAAPSTDYNTACEQFINKKAALSVDGSWWCGSITDPATTTVMAMPAYEGANKSTTDVIAGFSSGFYIARSAWEDEAKRDACVAFVEAATSPEAVASYVAQGGAPTCAIKADPNVEAPRPAVDGAAMVGAADEVDIPLGDRMATAYAEFISGAAKIMSGDATVDDVIAAFCEANK